jgi:cysteine-rich repeat protein
VRLPSLLLLLLLLALIGCRSATGMTDMTSSDLCDEGCMCDVDADCAYGLICASRMCVPLPEDSSSGSGESTSSNGSSSDSGSSSSGSGESSTGASEPAVCGDGVVGGDEECDGGGETKDCDDDCTVAACYDGNLNEPTGEECDDGNDVSSDACLFCKHAVCGDGYTNVGVEDCDDAGVEPGDGCSANCTFEMECGNGIVEGYEQCDDMNTEPGDGCNAICKYELLMFSGVKHDLPAADLVGWEMCWSDSYYGNGKLVGSIGDSCTKTQLLMACRPFGSGTLALAAHSPREDVMYPVDYSLGERHIANGVAWYWSPEHGHVGFGPSGNTNTCEAQGEDDQLCWLTGGGGDDDTFTFGRRCGAKPGFTVDEAPMWERLVFQAN